jgi:hypothetical protein
MQTQDSDKGRQADTATATLVSGVAALLAAWEQSDDLASEGAAKIVRWLVTHKRIHEAITENVA